MLPVTSLLVLYALYTDTCSFDQWWWGSCRVVILLSHTFMIYTWTGVLVAECSASGVRGGSGGRKT